MIPPPLGLCWGGRGENTPPPPPPPFPFLLPPVGKMHYENPPKPSGTRRSSYLPCPSPLPHTKRRGPARNERGKRLFFHYVRTDFLGFGERDDNSRQTFLPPFFFFSLPRMRPEHHPQFRVKMKKRRIRRSGPSVVSFLAGMGKCLSKSNG